MRAAVFAYGSLPGRFPAQLSGWRRSWHVCTENTDPTRAVAYYRPGTRDRLPGQILFLTVERDPGSTIDGTLLVVPPRALADLDAREGNYERVDVTSQVDVRGDRRPAVVWTYVGREPAVWAARRGIERGTAVVWRRYLDRLREIGVDEPLPPGVPVVDLDRRVRGEPTDPYAVAD